VEQDKISEVTQVRAVRTAFDGLDPDGLDYLYRSAHIKVPFPLVAGVRTPILNIQTPPHMVWDISSLEFFGLIEVGNNWADVPDDFVRDMLIYRLKRNDRSPWNCSTANVGGVPFDGFDVLNRNVLTFFGDIPQHVVYTGGAVLTVEVEIINAAWVAPVTFRAGVRVGGREVQKDKWEEVAV